MSDAVDAPSDVLTNALGAVFARNFELGSGKDKYSVEKDVVNSAPNRAETGRVEVEFR